MVDADTQCLSEECVEELAVAELTAEADGVLTFATVSDISAGKPCLVKPTIDVVNIITMNTTVSTGLTTNSGNSYQFVGLYAPSIIGTEDYFMAANNTLYWWAGTANSQLNNFRAYFKVNTNSGANNAPRHGMRARIIKNELEEQVATGMENVQGENQSLKLLENGQVVIIRNGKKYNAAGQLVK